MYNSLHADDNSNCLILAHFHDGYSLRNVFQFLRNTCRCVHMLFGEDSIVIKEENAKGSIFAECEIRVDDLTDYIFNCPVEPLVCSFDAIEMQKATKAVGKKDGIKLYVKGGNNPSIYIEVLNVGSGSFGDGLKLVPLIDSKPAVFTDMEYKRKKANARPPINQFSKFCADIASHKCTSINIIGFETGILIQGMESNIPKTIKRFGNINLPALPNMNGRYIMDGDTSKPQLNIHYPDEVARITIDTHPIQAMGKFNNLCPTGIIKIFLEEDKPLKIISNIGCYGTLTLYIKAAEE
jgi:hypothetical protein